MGKRKMYALTDVQADVVRAALLTYRNQLLDDLDNGLGGTRRTLAVLARASRALRTPTSENEAS